MPKLGLNINELAKKITDQAEKKVDMVVDSRSMQLLPVEQDDVTTNAPVLMSIDDSKQMEITSTAHRQLATRLQIPYAYYERVMNNNPVLLAENVNNWLGQTQNKRMIRTYQSDGSTVWDLMRADLSNKYLTFDNEDVAEAVLPVMFDEQLEIISSNVTEKKLYIKAVTDKLTGEIGRGDVVRGGVIVSNSEVGYGSVNVQAFIERLVCMNGMIAETSFRRRHIGASHDITDLLSRDTLNKTSEALVGQVQDVVRNVLSHEGFNNVLGKLRETTETEIAKPIDAVEIIQKQFRFTEDEKDSVLNHLIKGGDTTKWGLTNAVTRASQDLEDYDRATEFEKFGWDVANLSNTVLEPALA
tara:strand:- start:1961 stop:3031 length:1071 start_codon:yes stop_codon:yes gene_type:complete